MVENTPVVGKIVWHDFITNEIETSLKFYKALFNWDYIEIDSGFPEKYNMIQVDGKNIGGFMKPILDNVPSHWIAYVTVQDVDKSAEQVKKYDGKIIVGPRDIPNIGRFAVCIDPQGAAIDLFKGKEDELPCKEPPKVGEFCWDECLVDDPEAAKKFYGSIFNWSFKEMDMGEMGIYWIAMRSGTHDAAGIMKKPAEISAPSHWLTYILVQDLDTITKKTAESGGKIVMEPTSIFNIGKISIIQDNVGGVIGLLQPVSL